MADFLICPRCRRQNPADAIFCNRCGVRLLSAGVSYRNRGASNAVGMGQIALGLGVLILAGLVLGGGAVVFLGGQRPTPSRLAVLPSTTGLPTFVQPTATPAPSPTFVLPTLIPTPAPSATVAPTIAPTTQPTATPEPVPEATPVDCAVASTGSNVRTLVLGYGNSTSRGPIGKVWCIRDVTFHPVFNPGTTTGYGTARLMRGNKEIESYTCTTSTCGDGTFSYVPPKRVPVGSTLSYQFTCQDSDDTIGIDDCADTIDDGMTIIIHYEAFASP